jgi:hypothetical protein
VTTVESVLAEARQLTPDEQLEVATILMDEAGDAAPEGWWQSIEPEIERISAGIKAGTVKTYSLEEVRRRIKERLYGTRSSLL